jgi:ubiquinone/menaquinone biosynthesis C-methylase UbiE
MQLRDADGIEAAAIAAAVSLDGKRVLDIGCGTGRTTRFAATRAASVYAFDPNAESIAEAQALMPDTFRERVTFAVHGAEELDLPRRRFDLALAAWSL